MDVAVSFPILADIVQNVTGDRARAWSVVPLGADVHTWDAAPRDIARLARSDAFILMGASHERFVEDGGWFAAADEAKVPILEYAKGLELIVIQRVVDHGDHVHDLTGGDPHIWLDPMRVVGLVRLTVDFMVDLDPQGAATYRKNAERYSAELRKLDEEIRAGLASIPPERRKLVVFHDAFRYFAARYQFEVLEYVVKSTGQEPSARDVVAVHEALRASGVPAVFREPQFNTAVLDRIAADRNVKIGMLLSDTFTEDVTTYLDLMRFNLRSLVTNLG
ncbi:MAG: metal ABC transporter substrate-binding protein [Chloroflexi bacterium]|nr:metal ABC transporter substrate-binding protein [Chloroflexota bacterium]